MKIHDRRNKNKMIKKHKEEVKNKKLTSYRTEHGPYKAVSFVNLGGDMTKLQKEHLNCNFKNLNFFKDKQQNFLFIDTSYLSNIEAAYITRCSDIVVFTINSDKLNDAAIILIKRHLPACIFVVMSAEYLKVAKDFVKVHVPGAKVIEYSNLVSYLCILKEAPSKIMSRPFMIPTEIMQLEENIFVVKGCMKKGLQSNKIIANGKYSGEILEIAGNVECKGYELNMSDEMKINFTLANIFKENEMEIIGEIEGEGSIIEDSNEEIEEYSSHDSTEVSEYPSLIDKYAEYKGIKNIATCDLPADKYPNYYRDLLFFEDFKCAKKIITERKSIVPDNQIIIMKIRFEMPMLDNILVLFNLYEFEECKTIYNFSYQGDLIAGQRLFVDFGHKIIEVTANLTKAHVQNLYKREEALSAGVLSFIAPLSFNIHKILIFDHNPFGELSIDTFKCVGIEVGIKDRKLYDEVVLTGLPIKIYKRSCIVKRMFYSKEEVLYYKDIKLYTKNGRSYGYIKKPLGVHGSFRAYFSHSILSNDKIYMSLYKRVFLEDYSGR